VAITLRESLSADWNRWSAVLRNESGSWPADVRYPAIVDRIGTGDAFAAGLIHGLAVLGSETGRSISPSLRRAQAWDPGRLELAAEKDILALAAGDRSGRVQR